MRYLKKMDLVISDDEQTNPKKIRFEQEDFTDLDDINIVGLKVRVETFPIGSVTLSMEHLATAHYFYILPEITNVTVEFNGDANPKTFLADKASELWMVFTSAVITTTAATKITIAYGGL